MTTATLPATWAALEAALRQRRPIAISYHGRQRLVCPHALGWHNARALLLGYQSGGQTSTGTLPADPRLRWRCFFVDEVDLIDEAGPADTWQTAVNYDPARPFPANNAVVTVAISGTATQTTT